MHNEDSGATFRPSSPRVQPRLLIVTGSAELYGSDRSLLNALDALVGAFDVTLAFPSPGPAVAAAQNAGAHTMILSDYALRRRNFKSPWAVAKWLNRVRSAKHTLDRHHRHMPFTTIYSNTFAAFIGPVLRNSWKIRHILHVRECPMEPRWQISILCKSAARTSDVVLCNSNYTKGLITKVQPNLGPRTRVVHNGIAMPLESAMVEPRTSGALRISCVGRIHPKKGQSVLLDAASMAQRDGRNWELHFFGDALAEHRELSDGLRAQAKTLGIESSVTWHGFVDGEARYNTCDVAVVPSVYPEEFSLVCAEAQAMGLPVVATGPGGPSEILIEGETGFIVAPRDPAALYRAIAALDDDRALAARFGAAGSARVREHFSLDAYCANVVTALQST